MNKKILNQLSSMPHFSFLSKEEKLQTTKAASVKHLAKGTRVAVQGETNIDEILVILKGMLTLYDAKTGDIAGYIKKGEVFGGISILLNAQSSLRTAVVEIDVEAISIPSKNMIELCAGNKAFYDYFLENFSKNMLDKSLDAFIEAGQARLFLKGVAPFTFLSEAEIDAAAKTMSVATYKKDTVLFVQGGTRIGYLYILQKGSAERYYTENQKKLMREMLSEGDVYGGISILLNDALSVRTLQVTEDTRFYLLPKQFFLDLCALNKAFAEFFSDTFGRRMLNRSYASIIAKTAQTSGDQLQFFNQTVEGIYSGKPVFADENLSIKDAALKMVEEKTSYVFVKNQNNTAMGIVTEKDMSRRVVSKGFGIDNPVSEITSCPVHTIGGNALVFEALMTMMEKKIKHIAVTDADETIIGMLSNSDIISSQGQSPLFLLKKIAASSNVGEIKHEHDKLPGLVRSLITNGASAKNITRFITTISDAILKRIMTIVLDQVGSPPVPFVFMILGSEGRREQTLKTDQDNAIVYENPPEGKEKLVAEYFLKIGEMICNMLNEAGYHFCKGEVMAKNPKWNGSLSQWKSYFTSWIHAAEPEDLLQASIFFDFRAGYGETSLIDSLRDHLFNSLGDWSGFFRHLTENALHFRPPIGFFRNFVVESKGRHRNVLDIKSAMTPVVDFTRIYSLEHRIEETNTFDRLYQLQVKQVLTRKEYEELDKAYSFMMQLRFARQISAVVEEKEEPDNYINPKKMTKIEQTMLKEIFKRLEKIQSKLTFDFVGMA